MVERDEITQNSPTMAMIGAVVDAGCDVARSLWGMIVTGVKRRVRPSVQAEPDGEKFAGALILALVVSLMIWAVILTMAYRFLR